MVKRSKIITTIGLNKMKNRVKRKIVLKNDIPIQTS